MSYERGRGSEPSESGAKVGGRSQIDEYDSGAPSGKIGHQTLVQQIGPSPGGGTGTTTAPVQRKPDPNADQADSAKPTLRDWEVDEELAKLKHLQIDDASIRTVQEALQTPPTGAFNAADTQALSRLRVAHGLSRYIELGQRTLDLLIQQGIPLGMQDELLHLVTDALRIDTRSDTLSIRYSKTLVPASSTNFDPAGMRMILIGDKAFHSAASLAHAIRAELDQPVPDPMATRAAGTAPPSTLKPDEAAAAAGFNAGVISDQRAARAIQSTLGAPVTGTLDATTAQFIAQRQQIMNISPADGSINETTLQELIRSLGRGLGEESAIRLIIDFFRIPDDGITSVTFDPTLNGQDYRIESRGNKTAPAIIMGTDIFVQPPARIAHTVGRAFEDVRLRKAGTHSDVREFLLERFVTVGSTMPSGDKMADEEFVPFMSDAVQALAKYKALDKADQASVWTEFEQVRNKVIDRWSTADPQLQQTFQEVEDEYMAMRPPI